MCQTPSAPELGIIVKEPDQLPPVPAPGCAMRGVDCGNELSRFTPEAARESDQHQRLNSLDVVTVDHLAGC